MLNAKVESLALLPVSVQERIDELCTAFERAWRQGDSPDLAEYWSVRQGETGRHLFIELFKVECEQRQRLGERPTIAEYTSRFPDQVALMEHLLTSSTPSNGVQTDPNRNSASTQHGSKTKTEDVPVGDLVIPGYDILEVIGRGGMGTVYKARQHRLGRFVALKIIREEMRTKPGHLKRFLAEAEAVAQLRHPGIVQVFDYGEHNGVPYLTLEYIDGGDLSTRLQGEPIPPRQAATWLHEIAKAVAAAHEQKIVHRDLKPANVLVLRSDASESTQEAGTGSGVAGSDTRLPAQLVLKITDFGLAKREEQANLTVSGEIIGTPKYMSPEQAAGKTKEIGPTTDVYALGAILYEMLTGRPPFVGSNSVDTMQLIVREDPVPPSRLVPNLPRDPETICLHCLAKDPQRRYPDAGALVADLQRYLEHKPIQARPIGPVHRAMKWARLKPTLTALIALGVVALAVILGGGWLFTWQLQLANEGLRFQTNRAKAAEEDANDKADKLLVQTGLAKQETLKVKKQHRLAEVNRYAFQIQLAEREMDAGNYARAEQLLQSSDKALRSWEFDYLWARCRRVLSDKIVADDLIALGPKGKFLVVAAGKSIQVWDWRDRKAVFTFPMPANRPRAGAWFSPDGKRLKLALTQTLAYKELDLIQGKVIESHGIALGNPLVADRGFSFSPDGQLLGAMNTYKLLTVVNATSREILWQKRFASMKGTFPPVFTIDSKGVIFASDNVGIQVYEARTGDKLKVFANTAGQNISRMHLSPDGRHLLVERTSNRGIFTSFTTIEVLEFDTGKQVYAESFQGGRIGAKFVHPTKPYLAVPTKIEVQIRNYRTHSKIRSLAPHLTPVQSMDIDSSGNRLATVGTDAIVRVCQLNACPAHRQKYVHDADYSWDLSPDGSLLTIRETDFGFKVFSTDTWEEVFSHSTQGGMHCGLMDFSPDGKQLAVSFGEPKPPRNGQVVVWAVSNWQEQWTHPTESIAGIQFTDQIHALMIAPLSRQNRSIEVWDIERNRLNQSYKLTPGMHQRIQADPSSERIVATKKKGNRTELWDLKNGKRFGMIPTESQVQEIALASDNRLIAAVVRTKDRKGEVLVQDADSGTERLRLRWKDRISSVVFSPDGKRLIIAHQSEVTRTGALSIWDIETRQQILTLPILSRFISFVRFSRDGRVLSSCGSDNILYLWDARME